MYELPKLPYDLDALEPYYDAQTLEIHYNGHHQAYTDKLNAALESYNELQEKSIEELLSNLKDIPEDIRSAIQNNGGGYANHVLFWNIMGPKKEIDTNLVEEIEKTFGSIESFKELFVSKAMQHFGSGWAWLVGDENSELQIYTLPNQDSPISKGHIPILTLDLWEHAYYLKYKNKKKDFYEAWWNIVKILP